jgi:hypothetical protein
MCHKLVIAVAEEKQAKEDAGDEQYGGVDGAFIFVGGKKECFELHKNMLLKLRYVPFSLTA